MNWSILDPRDCTRLWSVECMNYDRGGQVAHCWLKSVALKFARAQMDNWLFVYLVNEWTGERTTLKPIIPYPPPTIDEHGLILDGPGKGQYI